jgi:hypothetical protein
MKIDPKRPALGPPNLAAVLPSVAPGGPRGTGDRTSSGWPGGPVVTGAEGQSVRRLQVRGRAGIWEVIQDDRFYGHYMGYQAAFDAAEAAAMAIVANGGAADLRFKQGQAHQGVGGPAGGAGGPISAMRTMEFRAGSAPLVR